MRPSSTSFIIMFVAVSLGGCAEDSPSARDSASRTDAEDTARDSADGSDDLAAASGGFDADAHDDADPADSADAEPFEGCSAGHACEEGAICIPQGVSYCGACTNPPETCVSDEACRATDPTTICNPFTCACSAVMVCVPACTDDSCPPWEFCAPTGRCVANACVRASDCPANFVCVSPGDPHCARKGCSEDAACEGYCVSGLCYDEPGTCAPPPL